jgi:hypothetical protein
LTLASGSRLGPYEILSPLGAGGMGEVYRARDTRLNRDVAVKVLPQHLASDAEARSRFEREAQAVAALSHPNILAIHDFGIEDGVAYSVTELLEGESLRSRLEGGALSRRRAIDYAVQIANGLAAAHEKGIVHRDLKPENVFLTADERIKILDFGLAKNLSGYPAGAGTNAPTMDAGTEPGTVMGTMGYMSPEQVRGRPADARSDIFSFGAVLYEMLSGRRAFKRETAADTMTAILKEDPPELSETDGHIPPALDRIVRHCLEKSPEARFQSARDVAFNLEALSQASSTSMTGIPARSGILPLPRFSLLILAGAVVLALAVGFFAGRKLPGGSGEGDVAFHQLTFRRGFLGSARFASDGQSVVFSAQWDGGPAELFLKRPETPDALSLQLPPAEVLAISSTGQMAIALNCRAVTNGACAGTLAVVPMTGGAPRRVENDVQWVDWTPDGSSMALVHSVNGRSKLEFPPGKVLFETDGHISWPRFSPDGKTIAFFDHPFVLDDRGSVAIVDPSGRMRRLSRRFESAQGLAWSASGDEVWFTAATSGAGRALRAVTLAGKERTIASVPGGLTLRDVSKAGRVLLTHENMRKGIMGRGPGATSERELSWLEWSLPTDLSDDGRTLLFIEQGQAVGEDYVVCLRKTDGSPVVQLGPGNAYTLSPDGRWALSRLPHEDAPITLLPTGTGQPRPLPRAGLTQFGSVTWLPDSRHILFLANEPGKLARVFEQDIDGGPPSAVSPAGMRVEGFTPGPDGESFLSSGPDGKPASFPLGGGPPRPILVGIDLSGIRPIRWSGDGRSILVRDQGRIPVGIYRLDIATGRRTHLYDLSPGDPAGLQGISRIFLSADGKSYVYGYTRVLSDLYLADGLK